MFFHFESYTINLAQVVSIEWFEAEGQTPAYATVTLANGDQYDVEGVDCDRLKQAVGK